MKKLFLNDKIKYIIPCLIVTVALVVLFIGNQFKPKQALGSAYNINELESNFDSIKIGDEVNYEINGYSDWQVIGKDEYTGTIDVVSKTNTEDLTLEYGQSKEYYENKFQEIANKYIDNNYAVRARTVNQGDLDYFNYDNDFWLNSVSDTNILTSQGTWELKNYKMYVIPYVEKYFENITNYNIGDTIDYSNNGVNRWIVVEKSTNYLKLIPETPIEIKIDGVDDNIGSKLWGSIRSFNNDVYGYGTCYIQNIKSLISNFLNQQTEKIIFLEDYCGYPKTENKLIFACGEVPTYENGIFGSTDVVYTDPNPYTLGYRPVITLKVKKEVQDKDKQEISSKLQVGDNVKYEAKGYKNWKVLSVDKDNNTIDIISGGIVKNLTLSGKEDWDNYEDIIQREVDEYKNGSQAKKNTTVTLSDIKVLREIDKSILSDYWILQKSKVYLRHEKLSTFSGDIYNYIISTIKPFKWNNSNSDIDNKCLYTTLYGTGEEIDYYIKLYSNDYSYTAGLRPVITLKLDSVEKLPDEEVKKIEESTEKQEKIYIKEQESKNKDYKGPIKVNDSTSSTGNNNEVKTNNNNDNTKDNITDNNTSNVEKIVYKDKPFYKYGFYILLVICLIETLMLIIPKINKK